jgi:hypothetical protein
VQFAREVDGLRLASDAIAAFMIRNDEDGGGGESCAGKCMTEYNKCINEYNCDPSSIVCICCVPCSLAYAGCLAKCVKGSIAGDWVTTIA